MMRTGFLLVVLAACSKAESPVTDRPDPGLAPKAPEIKVELSGVTLAEDCADGRPTKPTAPPPVKAAAGSNVSSDPSASMPPPNAKAASVAADMPSAGACAPGVPCGGIPQPACEQTAMQLLVGVPAGAVATKLKIKTVELLDDKGAVAGTLTARAPSKWDGQGTYVTWDEAVTPAGGSVAVSYKLSAPDWNKLTGGIWNAASKKFALRVTVSISDKDRTIEKQAIVAVMPEPPVAT